MTQHVELSIPCPYYNFNYCHWQPGRSLDMHSHPYLQLIHVLQGDFHINVGDGWQTVAPGEVHVLPPGYSHALKTQSGHIQFGLNFRVEADERGWKDRLCTYYPRPYQILFPLPTLLQTFLENPPRLLDEVAELRLIGLLDDYCCGLIRPSHACEEETLKAQLLNFLVLHSDRLLTVEEISRGMKMSRSSLQRFCTKIFQCGARSLQERIRIEQAARLLLEEGLSVSECALRSGYADIFSFSRSFKRLKGFSPLQYRQHILNN